MHTKEEEILKLLANELTREKAFALLVDEYKEALYWQINTYTKQHTDTNDVLQNTFIKAWRYIDNFKQKSKLSSWLYRIAYNESMSFLKKKNKIKMQSLEDVQYASDNNNLITAENIMQKLLKALEILPPKQKAIFELRYFKNLKYKEISEILKTSEGALKASYHIAVKKIEAILKQD